MRTRLMSSAQRCVYTMRDAPAPRCQAGQSACPSAPFWSWGALHAHVDCGSVMRCRCQIPCRWRVGSAGGMRDVWLKECFIQYYANILYCILWISGLYSFNFHLALKMTTCKYNLKLSKLAVYLVEILYYNHIFLAHLLLNWKYFLSS